MTKVEIWGLGGLKPKQDHSTGEWIRRVTATVEFGDVDVSSVGHFNNKKNVLLTEEEYEALMGGKQYLVSPKFVSMLKTVRTVVDDAITEAETV